MEIRGTNFQQYDSAHLQQVQREAARSVKPNVLKQLEDDLDNETLLKLISQDLVELSPDARELLKKIRRRLRRDGRKFSQEELEDFESLLAGLEELRHKADDEEADEDKGQRMDKPFLPPVITLSTHVPGASRNRPAAAAAASEGPQVSSQATQLVGQMLVYAPSSELKEHLQRELAPMGVPVISEVKRFGVRIIVLARNVALTDLRVRGMQVVAAGEKTFDGRPWARVRGLYDQSRRLLVLGQELLGMKNRSAARHEFAHAYDHMYSERNRRRLPLSVQLWNTFRQERTDVVSDYAATNPAEYFAESVEAFFEQGAREHLAQADPQMYDYLCELFAS